MSFYLSGVKKLCPYYREASEYNYSGLQPSPRLGIGSIYPTILA